MPLQSINPYNNKVFDTHKEFTDDSIKDSISKVAETFAVWKNFSFQKRAKYLKNISKLLLDNTDEYARIITLEMGKPINESRAEVKKCAWVCDYYAKNAGNQLKKEIISTDALSSKVHYEPLGTIFGIMPWNFPFWQVFRFLAPSLMAGNTVLLKHASNVQKCALQIEEICRKAGLPEFVFKSLIITSNKVNQVINNKHVKAITLTGSEFAGSSVAAAAGKNIKKTVMELGGSNAFIVLDDADIERSVDVGIMARFQNAGQSCIAAKRFFVMDKIADEFITKFITSVRKLNVGNPFNENINIGPLVNIDAAKDIEELVTKSLKMGAKAEITPKRENALFYPTVLTNVKKGMPVMDEETFGPVAPVIIVHDDDEAIQMANDTKFGLGVSIMTQNIKRAEKMIPKFDDGAVFINSLVKSDPRLPFGGTKKSGYGRELSGHGIKEFVNVKTVYID